MQKKHEKIIKAVVADNESNRLRITFKDGAKGQLTYKQLESFYGMFYLPDMVMPLPDNMGSGKLIKSVDEVREKNKKNWINGTMTFNEAVDAVRNHQSNIIQAMLGNTNNFLN